MGSDADFEVSLRIGGDADEPPLTMYVEPSEDSPVGVLVIGPLTVEPVPDRADHKRDASGGEQEPPEHPHSPPQAEEEPKYPNASHQATKQEPTYGEVASDAGVVERVVEVVDGQPDGGVVRVALDLSHEALVADHGMTQEERVRYVADERRSTEETSRAELWELRQDLLNAGVELVFGYDPEMRLAVLVHVSDESTSRRQRTDRTRRARAPEDRRHRHNA